jgi:hypothetical protein
VKIYVAAAAEALRKKERQGRKLMEKLVGVPVFFCFVKFSFPVTHLMPYYAETDCSRSLIGGTLPISLIDDVNCTNIWTLESPESPTYIYMQIDDEGKKKRSAEWNCNSPSSCHES